MAVYLITYDLKNHASSDDYKELHELIESFGTWWHYLESTWLVDTILNADTMSARIKAIYQPENHLVIKLARDDRQGWFEEGAWDWIRSHLG